ncbi:MAG: prepilin-type N-terminal cleavage/methylation domain-containing protein [Clostridia bacterium]|nr:prepilin-type N-terminal cleavage/methylation domain-containing protein [Clostridia bacterium]
MRNNKQKGFTLVELLVVIAILAILATVATVGYTAFIKQAHVSNDENVATQLNHFTDALKADSNSPVYEKLQANGGKITVDNVRDITDYILTDSGLGTLVPQSADYGYHFYFDLDAQEYVLIGDDDPRMLSMSPLGRLFAGAAEYSLTIHPEQCLTKDSRYFLVETGTELARLVAEFKEISDKDKLSAYHTSVSTYETDARGKLVGLIALVERTVFTTNVGHLVVDTTKNHDHLFVQKDLVVSNKNNHEITGLDGVTVIDKTHPLVALQSEQVIEISIKDDVTLATHSWWFANPEKATLVIKGIADPATLATRVDIDFTNAKFILDDGKTYTYKNGSIMDADGNSTPVEGKNKVKDFTVTCDGVEAGVVAFGNSGNNTYSLYIHYNKTEAFNLGATGFKGTVSDVNISGTDDVKFEKISGSSKLTVTEDGKVQVTGYPETNDLTAKIKVTCGVAEPKTIDVTIVRVTNASVPFNGSTLTMSDNNNTLTISYTGNKVFTFGTASFADNSSNTGINIVAADKQVTITHGAGDVFTISDNKTLTLNKFEGTQTFTITVGKMSKTFTVTVEDNSKNPFDIKWDTDKDAGIKYTTSGEGENAVKIPSFLYRVGNDNAITLGTLFNTIEEFSGNATLTIYDASQKSGTTYKEINTSNPNLNASYDDAKTLSYSDWASKKITFKGEGVAIIEITYNKQTVKVAVEVVDGYNVLTYGDLSAKNASNQTYKNFVLQNDIEMPSEGALNLQGNFFGNGYTFDITKGKYHYTEGGRNGIITLYGGALMDNVVIIGDKYTTICDAHKNAYYVAAIGLEGGILSNSYVYGCQTPVRSTGGKIINTVLDGGRFANLICKGGKTTVEDITTINQATDKYCGLGIVVEGGATLNVDGSLTQHNWISSSDKALITDNTISTFFDLMFGISEIKFNHSNDSWVNTGIFLKDATAIVINAPSNYIKVAKSYSSMGITATGYAYSFNNSVYSFTGKVTPNAYTPVTQGAYAPKLEWTYPEGYNSTTNTITIKVDEGAVLEFDPNFLLASKYGNNLQVVVKVNGQDYTGNKIAINSTADNTFTITYSYTDTYVHDMLGAGVVTSINYVDTVEVSVQVIKQVGAPDFTFHYGTNGSASAGSPHVTQPSTTVSGIVVTAGADKYIMPDVSATQDNKIGSTTVNNVTIYYPIVDGINVRSGASTDYDFLRYYPIFKGVTISDDTRSFGYTTTKEMPSYFTWVSASIDSGNSSSGLATDKETGAILYTCYNDTYLSRYQTQKGNTEGGGTSVVKYSYQAVDGNTYYYYIGYRFYDEDEGGACVTGDTLVTLADGTQKEIRDVTAEDILLVWNHFTGKYDTVPAAIIFNHGYDYNTVIKLNFSDGTQVKMINLHQFLDADLNKYVTIDSANVQDYVGHNFVKQDGDSYTTVTLESYEISEEYIEAYGIISALHYNFFVEGMFSTDFKKDDYDLFNYFTMGENMMFDAEQMQSDIDTYGLYTYEDFAEYLTYEQFVGFNVQYFKIAVGKGYYTYEGILDLIATYLGK